MKVNDIVGVLGAIVVVAGITTAVKSPNTSKIIGAFGQAFAGSLRAAMGS